MKGYKSNIENLTLENQDFRHVLYTTSKSQLVLMSIPVGQDIGEEIHHLDQFIRCEKGQGMAILDGVEYELGAGFAVVVPPGSRHNIINKSSSEPLKLYTLYSPPNHKDKTVHKTKQDAEKDEEHFDGQTSE